MNWQSFELKDYCTIIIINSYVYWTVTASKSIYKNAKNILKLRFIAACIHSAKIKGLLLLSLKWKQIVNICIGQLSIKSCLLKRKQLYSVCKLPLGLYKSILIAENIKINNKSNIHSWIQVILDNLIIQPLVFMNNEIM